MKENEDDVTVGLEIHLQLSTDSKLFCECPTRLSEDVTGSFVRKLRPTQSELGQVDPAALFEFERGFLMEYHATPDSTCLVEMDEEPPHTLDQEALRASLRVALLFGCEPVDEVHVMRKVVIDGSNTAGFQRTAIVALGGEVDKDGESVGIQTVSLEEDAARLRERTESRATYVLDRLGIPLVEIATAPEIHSAEEAVEVAKTIGRWGKATGYVGGELGTIRQDVNLSVRGGNPVEVKGVQRLTQLEEVVRFEESRQKGLLEIQRRLDERGVEAESIERQDVARLDGVFENTDSEVIKKGLRDGKRVLGLRLPGFAGLLSKETAEEYRLALEMLERVKFWTDAEGFFHTDELPGYGVSSKETEELKEAAEAGEGDAVVLVVDDGETAEKALGRVRERAVEALDGVPYETRGPGEDGTTFYMRPRPGLARMYPETDIPPVTITDEYLREVSRMPVEDPERKVEELVDEGLSEGLARSIYDSAHYRVFEELKERLTNLGPAYVANTLLGLPTHLESEGLDLEVVPEEKIERVFLAADRGDTAKESVEDLVAGLCEDPSKDVQELIDELGLGLMSRREVRDIVRDVIEDNPDVVSRDDSFSKIMGFAMSEVRGRATADLVSEVVREELSSKAEQRATAGHR